jgi:radical SAM superfamily enzyme YgiQ (UPF0313 family)
MKARSILIVQLPPPRFRFEEPPTNIPLAGGFMATVIQNALGSGVEVEIPAPHVTDVFADRALAERIAGRRPDALLLTLYLWNAQRSLFLASNVKRREPGTAVIVGGPEVSPDNEWVLNHPAIDAGVFGEGESRIVSLLEALFERSVPVGVPGVFYSDSNGLHLNTESAEPWDLRATPYPYVTGTLPPAPDGTIFLETVRGCPFKCKYCCYHKAFDDVKLHPEQAVREVLDFAYAGDSAVSEIYLMDPTFNVRKGWREIIREMGRKRQWKDLSIHTELRADLLTRSDVRLLSSAGLRTAEIGLQTTNKKALHTAGRSGSPDDTARGVAMLKESDVDVTTGIILGLPADDPAGFSRTLDWLEHTLAYSQVLPFVLSVLPGTDFRARSRELGLTYSPRPPYYVTSTPTFSNESLSELLLEFEQRFDVELDAIPLPSLIDRGPEVLSDADESPYISKWIIDMTAAKDPFHQIDTVLSNATDPFTIWLRGPVDRCTEDQMVSMLSEFRDANPHAVLHIVLELDKDPASSFIDRLMRQVADPGMFVNQSYGPLRGHDTVVTPVVTVVRPHDSDPAVRNRIKAQYGNEAVVVWSTELFPETSLNDTEPPLVIDLPEDMTPEQQERLLGELFGVHDAAADEIRFRTARHTDLWSRISLVQEDKNLLPEHILTPHGSVLRSI